MEQDHPIATPPDPPDAGAAGQPVVRERRRAPRADWVDARLKTLYDRVAAEPIPDELQAVIDRLTAPRT